MDSDSEYSNRPAKNAPYLPQRLNRLLLNIQCAPVWFQIAQTISNFATDFLHPHAFLHHQLAGDGGPLLCPVTQVVNHAAVLAIFIPTKTPVGDGLWGQ